MANLGYKTIEAFALQPSTGVGEVGRSPKIVILATGVPDLNSFRDPPDGCRTFCTE
jgi:hypothetical protein